MSRKIIISLTAASYDGLFWAGDAYLLGVQALAVLVITVWSMVSTFVLLFTIDLVRIVTSDDFTGAFSGHCEIFAKLR